jgi:hypothetical protein
MPALHATTTRSSLQILVTARAMTAVCAHIQVVSARLSGTAE